MSIAGFQPLPGNAVTWEIWKLDQPLTVVLPMYNFERQLRSSVLDILDFVTVMPRPAQIVIVDDGSTDDTYETACELARQYPQLTVLRQSLRQGLSAALELVRNRLAVEKVLVHDGVSAIDADQLRMLFQADTLSNSNTEEVMAAESTTTQTYGSRRFAAVRALHEQMEQAHRLATSFHWVQLEKPLVPRRRQMASPTTAPTQMPTSNLPVSMPNLPLGMSPLPQS